MICSDCADDDELEQKILAQLTDIRPETSGAAAEAGAAWVEAAAKAWTRPAQHAQAEPAA